MRQSRALEDSSVVTQQILRGNGVGGLHRRRLLRALAALPMVALAPGCSLPVPGQGPPPQLFRLTPKSTFRENLPQAEWQLVLAPPVAEAGLNTTRIAMQRRPTPPQYHAAPGWRTAAARGGKEWG